MKSTWMWKGMMVYMKKHRSVFQLIIRCNFYRVLGLLAVMVVVQTGLFCLTLNRGCGVEGFGLEYVFEKSRIELVFIGVFIAMDIFLRTSTGYGLEGKRHYTMMRLSVTRKEMYYWHFVSNVLYYLLFFTVQLLTVVMLGMLYVKQTPAEYVTGQTLFLAFYRNNFCHSLLPLGDVPYLIRNILIVISAAMWSAYYPKDVEAEKKKKHFNSFVFLPVLFIGEFGDYFYCSLLVIFGTIGIIWKIGKIRKEELESRQEEIIEKAGN